MKDYRTPFRLLVITAGSVFIAEAFIMLLLPDFTSLSDHVKMLLDASSVTILVLPTLYFFLFRPMILHIAEHERTGEAISKLSRAVEQTADCVIIARKEGYIEYVNPAFEQQTGYSKEEALGNTPRILKSGVHPPEFYKNLWDTINAGGVFRGEVINRKKGGQLFHVEHTITPLKDESGATTHFVSVWRDITRRKEAEEVLRQQLMRISLLNQIARSMAERQDLDDIFRVVVGHLEEHLSVEIATICTYDARRDTLTVTAVGPNSQQLGAEWDLRGKELRLPEETELRPCAQGETVYVTDTENAEAPLLRQYACCGIRSTIIVPLMANNSVLGTLGLARREVDGFKEADHEFLKRLGEHVALAGYQAQLHHELQQAYDELRRTQQQIIQQERLRALGEMASGVAHDFNNALTSILGYTKTLLAYPDLLDDRDQAISFLETIDTAAKDAAAAVSRLRDFYRRREDTEVLQPLDLNQLIDQTVSITRPKWHVQARSKGAAIDLLVDLQRVPTISGMEAELRQALVNLIFNATDSIVHKAESEMGEAKTALPGTITLRTRVSEGGDGQATRGIGAGIGDGATSRSQSATLVVLEVSDTGTGMTEETRQHCLEPFFTTKGEQGTGLGLATVYGIIRRHEGSISIETEWGGGTTFIISFPPHGLSQVEGAEIH